MEGRRHPRGEGWRRTRAPLCPTPHNKKEAIYEHSVHACFCKHRASGRVLSQHSTCPACTALGPNYRTTVTDGVVHICHLNIRKAEAGGSGAHGGRDRWILASLGKFQAVTDFLRIKILGAGEKKALVKSTPCSCRGPIFDSHHSYHNHLQPGDPKPLVYSIPHTGACTLHRCVYSHTSACTYTQVGVLKHRCMYSHTGACTRTQVHVVTHRCMCPHTQTHRQLKIIKARHGNAHL